MCIQMHNRRIWRRCICLFKPRAVVIKAIRCPLDQLRLTPVKGGTRTPTFCCPGRVLAQFASPTDNVT